MRDGLNSILLEGYINTIIMLMYLSTSLKFLYVMVLSSQKMAHSSSSCFLTSSVYIQKLHAANYDSYLICRVAFKEYIF